MYLILLFISFAGGIIPWVIDKVFFDNMDISITFHGQILCYTMILWGVVIQFIVYFIGRKMKLYSIKRFKIPIMIGFFCLTIFIYIASLLFVFAIIFAWTMSQM